MQYELWEAATSLSNKFIVDAKQSNKKVIGYNCSFLPLEVIDAAGIVPYHLRAIEIDSMEIGDTYFGPYVCSFPKCLLQLAGEGKYSFLDGSIITPGCDSIRRIDECWRAMEKDIPGSLPKFFFYFGTPHKCTDYSLQWFEQEIKGLITALEAQFGVKITESALRKSIKTYNKGRKLLTRLNELRYADEPLISGTDAMAIMIAGSVMPREDFNLLLKDLIEDLEKNGQPIKGRKRLMLVGSVSDDLALVKTIEEEGGLVVSDTVCFGPRVSEDLVDETMEPIAALAKRYLTPAICPRMVGKYFQRLSLLLRRANAARVDGVILQNIRFCDMHGSENGLYEKELALAGIPSIRLERECGPMSDSGRIRMRVNAFMEVIGK